MLFYVKCKYLATDFEHSLRKIQHRFKELISARANRLDLKVANGKKEIIIIEIQYEHEYDYFQRILFSASMAAKLAALQSDYPDATFWPEIFAGLRKTSPGKVTKAK